MMSLFKDLLGGGIISKGVDMADEAFHTSEEKGKLKLILLKLYEPYKLAQRLIALAVTIPFVGLHILFSLADFAFVMSGHNPVCGELSQRNIDTLGEGWSWIMIWYFTGGMVEGGVRAFKGLKK